jgi:nitroreductase
MDVFEAVNTVLAVRQFGSDPVPDDVVNRIVQAAHNSASGGNQQPWHFIVVRDRQTLAKIGELARTGPYIAQAPLAVAVAVEPGPMGMSDGSRAIQNMILTAWAEGVGSNWVGFGGGSPGMSDVAKLLGLPADFELLAVVPFGYPVHATRRGKKNRKTLGEVVSSERFGSPFGD